MPQQEVEVRVVDVKEGKCPHYKVGDKLVFKNQVFDPKWSTVDVFCVHSINDIYDDMMRLRKEQDITKTVSVPCRDKGICTFEIRLTRSE